ncbi:MAG: hypothetical protein M3380_11080 [Chloroflexota bacterium]|nr:hypothetical protein [Chloroflexota bacterium]
MIQPETPTSNDRCPTQHAMLIIWGHFARTIGLREQLATVPIRQKTVTHAPQDKLLEFLIGLLSGMEYLTDLSAGPAPLVKDPAVATAWQLETLADASTVSRTLKASDAETVAGLRTALDTLGQPFLDHAITDIRERQQPLVLDADLTGRPVSSTSRTYPDAAFGYMDGELRLGYQLAEICVQTTRFGRQWLSARHHPGSMVSAPCLLELIQDAERRLKCHPRRRTELVEQRQAASEAALAEQERLAAQHDQRMYQQTERLTRLEAQIHATQSRVRWLQVVPASRRQHGPYSQLSRLEAQIEGWQRQQERAQAQIIHAQAVAQRHRARAAALAAERDRLHAYLAQLRQDNAKQVKPPRCTIRLDAGFSSGENLTALIELGYDVETKSGNAALVHALQKQVTATMAWTRVGKNAEMIGWTNYTLHSCPYPLTVGLERFHTPSGLLHAVLIRSQEGAPPRCPDLEAWFHAYNARQTIEAGNKEEKTTFKVQHLMSRSRAGIEIQALLTVFAANFVRWATAWVQPRIEHSSPRFEAVLARPKHLVRVAANSPAVVDSSDERVRVCFSSLSSLEGVVVCVAGMPGLQLALPLFESHHFSSA